MRHGFHEQFELLGHGVVERGRQAGDVAARTRKTGCKTIADGIGGKRHDDGSLRRGLLKVAHRLGGAGNEDIGVQPSQLFGKFRVAFRLCLGKTPFDDKIPALDISECPHSLRKPAQKACFDRGRSGIA